MDEQNLVDLYSSGKSLRNIEKITGVHHLKVRKILIKLGVSRRSRINALILSKRNSFPINKYLESIINGEMLGDGHLRTGAHQSCFSCGSNRKEYMLWLANVFAQNGIPICGKGVFENKIYDKRSGKTYENFQFATLHSIELKRMRELWYVKNIKRVPKNLILNHTSLLHWWIGDGHLNKKNNYGWLATDCFSKEENYFLSSQLGNMEIYNSVRKCKVKNNNFVYRIYITRKGVLQLLHLIGLSPVNCYKYKWDCRG